MNASPKPETKPQTRFVIIDNPNLINNYKRSSYFEITVYLDGILRLFATDTDDEKDSPREGLELSMFISISENEIVYNFLTSLFDNMAKEYASPPQNLIVEKMVDLPKFSYYQKDGAGFSINSDADGVIKVVLHPSTEDKNNDYGVLTGDITLFVNADIYPHLYSSFNEIYTHITDR